LPLFSIVSGYSLICRLIEVADDGLISLIDCTGRGVSNAAASNTIEMLKVAAYFNCYTRQGVNCKFPLIFMRMANKALNINIPTNESTPSETDSNQMIEKLELRPRISECRGLRDGTDVAETVCWTAHNLISVDLREFQQNWTTLATTLLSLTCRIFACVQINYACTTFRQII
jgi:hypothetical protein